MEMDGKYGASPQLRPSGVRMVTPLNSPTMAVEPAALWVEVQVVVPVRRAALLRDIRKAPEDPLMAEKSPQMDQCSRWCGSW